MSFSVFSSTQCTHTYTHTYIIQYFVRFLRVQLFFVFLWCLCFSFPLLHRWEIIFKWRKKVIFIWNCIKFVERILVRSFFFLEILCTQFKLNDFNLTQSKKNVPRPKIHEVPLKIEVFKKEKIYSVPEKEKNFNFKSIWWQKKYHSI